MGAGVWGSAGESWRKDGSSQRRFFAPTSSPAASKDLLRQKNIRSQETGNIPHHLVEFQG
jgi:hypothetical protein